MERWPPRRCRLSLLDNAEQVAEAAPELARLLTSCPWLRLLVTSRAPLRLLGERELTVSPLGLPLPGAPLDRLLEAEAAQLFAARARDSAPGFALTRDNAVAVAAIVRRLDGLPLAIELAAARLRALSPQALLARLERRLPLLTGGPRDAPARQRTLRDAIAWSHDLLGPAEQTLFRRLAVFAGGWTLAAAEAVGGQDLSLPVLDGLEVLLAQSLVQRAPGQDRFGMLETIREFAEERLEASGEAGELGRQHGKHYLALAEEARERLTGAGQAAWLATLEAEHANLRAALEWLRDCGCRESALRLTGALGLPWFIRGHAAEGRALALPLLAAPEAAAPTTARARALGAVAFWSYALADPAELGEARALYHAALAIWNKLSDEHEVASTLNHLAVVEFHAGDYPAARALLEASLPALRQGGDEFLIASSLHYLSRIALVDGADRETEAYPEACLAIQRRRHDQAGLAASLLIAGLLLRRRGRLGAVRSRYEEALAVMREIDDRNSIGYALDALGGVALEQGDLALARAVFDELLAPLVGMGFTVRLSQALESHACLAVARHRPARALRLAGAAAALSEVFGRETQVSCHPDPAPWLAAARQALGENGTAAAWAEGQTFSLEQAVAYALATDADEPSMQLPGGVT